MSPSFVNNADTDCSNSFPAGVGVSPHRIPEDRALLESLVAKNRNAILALHNLHDSQIHKKHGSSAGSSNPEAAGSHDRNPSSSTGISPSRISDASRRAKLDDDKKKKEIPRRFSIRGVRLDVHRSILGLDAREASDGLQNKWIQRSHSFSNRTDGRETKTSELAMIPEANSTASSARGTSEAFPRLDEVSNEDFIVVDKDQIESFKPSGRTSSDQVVTQEASGTGSSGSDSRKNAKNLLSGAVGRGLRNAIRHLTIGSSSSSSEDKGKQREDFDVEMQETAEEEKKSTSGTIRRKWSLIAGSKSPLRTPDFEKEFEGGGV